MDTTVRERLRMTIGIALALLPRSVETAYADKATSRCDPARAAMVDKLIAEIDGAFDVAEKAEPRPYRGFGHANASGRSRSEDS